MSTSKRYNTNDRIRSLTLRVITSKGENLGVISKDEALALARKDGFDLVEIAPNANPPVAKMLDFKKFLYEERKKTSAAKAHTKQVGLKEFKFGPHIGKNDLSVKIERARNFLKEKNRVKFTVTFAGREIAYPQIGWEKIKTAVDNLNEAGYPEDQPKLVNKSISVVILPK